MPFSIAAKQLFVAAESGQVELVMSSLSFTTVHYVASKSLNAAGALAAITALFDRVTVAAVDEKVISQVLRAGMPDFEDAVQLFAAVAAKADLIVTRDPKGFTQSLIAVASPISAVALVS